MWRLSKHAALFAVGAIAYFEIELHWRYFAGTLPVHWTMPILGGVLFLLLGGLNEWLPWEMPFWGNACLVRQWSRLPSSPPGACSTSGLGWACGTTQICRST